MSGERDSSPPERRRKESAKRWREMLATEREAAALYQGLAAAETGERAEILRELAAVELRHAAHWEGKLREAGFEVPAPRGPGVRTRLLSTAARRVRWTPSCR